MKRIKRFLRKPVLFVSHFNTDYQGKSVPQRKLIVDAIEAVAVEAGCHAFDPTPDVLDAGLESSIKDLGHYTPEFEARIAERLEEEIRLALGPASAIRIGARGRGDGPADAPPLSLRSMVRDGGTDVGVRHPRTRA